MAARRVVVGARVVPGGPVGQLAIGLEELADGFRWQGDGVAARRLGRSLLVV